MKLKVRQILGIVMTAATVLTAVPVTGLTQPVEVSAAVSKDKIYPKVELSLSGSKNGTYTKSSSSKPAKIKAIATFTNTHKGDIVKYIEWTATNLSSGKRYTKVQKLNKKISKDKLTCKATYSIPVDEAGKYSVDCEVRALASSTGGDVKFGPSEKTCNVVYSLSAIGNEVTNIFKSQGRILRVKGETSASEKENIVKISNINVNSLPDSIRGEIANAGAITKLVTAIDSSATVNTTLTVGSPSFYIKDKSAKKYYKRTMSSSFAAPIVQGTTFAINTKDDNWKEFFVMNSNKGAYIKIPVTVKVEIKASSGRKIISKKVNVILEK